MRDSADFAVLILHYRIDFSPLDCSIYFSQQVELRHQFIQTHDFSFVAMIPCSLFFQHFYHRFYYTTSLRKSPIKTGLFLCSVLGQYFYFIFVYHFYGCRSEVLHHQLPNFFQSFVRFQNNRAGIFAESLRDRVRVFLHIQPKKLTF